MLITAFIMKTKGQKLHVGYVRSDSPAMWPIRCPVRQSHTQVSQDDFLRAIGNSRGLQEHIARSAVCWLRATSAVPHVRSCPDVKDEFPHEGWRMTFDSQAKYFMRQSWRTEPILQMFDSYSREVLWNLHLAHQQRCAWHLLNHRKYKHSNWKLSSL